MDGSLGDGADCVPVAQKTLSAGFKPNARTRRPRHRVAVVAFDGVVLGDLATPCDVFGLARDGYGMPAYEVRVCSIAPKVTSAHVSLDVTWRLSSVSHADTIVVPGMDDLGRPIPEPITQALRRARERGARIASMCTGAFVLAAAGVLDGLRATTHWLGAPELARRYPRVEVDPQVLYVDNGQVLTSAGGAAAFDLCLYLVRRDLGAELAAKVARAAVMPLERAGGQAQFITHEASVVEGTSMASLLEWLERNLRRDLSLPVIARRAAMSTRTFSRRFREHVGTTPARWLARARVRRAQILLESTAFSVERIASEVGFGSSTVLREHFGRVVGTSPMAYRRAFRSTHRQRPPLHVAPAPGHRHGDRDARRSGRLRRDDRQGGG
jgi:transcriptional regulator GlxA family with amidase domain